jgi:hypothetical protein
LRACEIKEIVTASFRAFIGRHLEVPPVEEIGTVDTFAECVEVDISTWERGRSLRTVRSSVWRVVTADFERAARVLAVAGELDELGVVDVGLSVYPHTDPLVGGLTVKSGSIVRDKGVFECYRICLF